jgi:3-isopropylmalate/(R)-2-methylmalate dehydratase large subunit
MRKFAGENKISFFDAPNGISVHVVAGLGLALPGKLILAADNAALSLGALAAASFNVTPAALAGLLSQGEITITVPPTIKVILNGRIPRGVFAKDIMFDFINKISGVVTAGRAIEFTGAVVDALSMDARFTICSMSACLSAECAVIPADKKTFAWLSGIGIKKRDGVYADNNCAYEKVIVLDISKLSPLVVKPADTYACADVGSLKGLVINEAFLGGPTNSRLEDLEITAKILRGRKIHPDVKFYTAPATQEIFLRALAKGFIKTIAGAGGMILVPGYGPCEGNHCGIPADGDVVISTANDNRRGIMGNANASVYLASPATVAASALRGRITDPRAYL